MSEEAADNLAVKIARLLQAEKPGADFYSLQASIERINERLGKIEATLDEQNSSGVRHSPFAISHSKPHPSREKFAIDEIIGDVGDGNSEQEKPCPYEPTGKPCDHCSMCNSLGF